MKKHYRESGITAAKRSVSEYLKHLKEVNENKRKSFMRKSKKFKNEGL